MSRNLRERIKFLPDLTAEEVFSSKPRFEPELELEWDDREELEPSADEEEALELVQLVDSEVVEDLPEPALAESVEEKLFSSTENLPKPVLAKLDEEELSSPAEKIGAILFDERVREAGGLLIPEPAYLGMSPVRLKLIAIDVAKSCQTAEGFIARFCHKVNVPKDRLNVTEVLSERESDLSFAVRLKTGARLIVSITMPKFRVIEF